MPKIYGLVNYKPTGKTSEDFNGFSYNVKLNSKQKLLFSHYNNHGAFVGLSGDQEKIAPYTIIYKNIKYTFIFDGKIQNSKELLKLIRDELGFFPVNQDDYGALAAWAYILWGGFSPIRLSGKFAYAIYSESVFKNSVYSPKLFIARDRLGIKPLYFSYENNDRIIFSSSAASIISYKDKAAKIDKFGLWQILFLNGYSIDGRTVFKDIYELQPGCCAYIDCRSDGSYMVMQKRYFYIKHPKYSNNAHELKEDLINKCDYIEENLSVKSHNILEDIQKCVKIAEVPYFHLNFLNLKNLHDNNFKGKIYSCIGKESFDFSNRNHIKSFFPWIHDPYENIEVLKRELSCAHEGFNWLYEVFIKYKQIFTFDENNVARENRIKMCLNYFINIPNQIKYTEKMADYFNLQIDYPYADANVFEYYYGNLENVCALNIKKNSSNIKNSEFEKILKLELKDIISNSEYRINYLLDKNKCLSKINAFEEDNQLQMIYLIHTWLETFNVDFDL